MVACIHAKPFRQFLESFVRLQHSEQVELVQAQAHDGEGGGGGCEHDEDGGGVTAAAEDEREADGFGAGGGDDSVGEAAADEET